MFAASKSGKVAAAAAATDASFAYVPLLLETTSTNGQQNNTFLDSSTNNFTITRNGTPTQGSITPYWPNGQWSNYFNGSSNLSVASNAALAMGSGDFTVEFWVYLRATTNDRTLSWPVVGNMAINCAPSGYWNYANYGVGNILTSSIITPLNTWTHVAISRTGTTTRIFINGVQGAITTVDANNWGQSVLNIGSDIASNFFNGYMSNLRIVKGVGVYTGAFTPPTTPLQKTQAGNGGTIQAITGTQTSLLTCQSNRFVNNSDISLTLTVANGTPTVQAFQPFSPTASYSAATYAGSGYFNGSTDYLSLADNTALQLSTGDFTIEGWFYISGATSTAYNLISKGAASTGWSLNTTTGARIQFSYTASNLTGATTTLVQGTWYHIAVVRSGSSSGNLKIYLNGVQEIASAGAVTDDFNQTSTMYVSASRTATLPLNGYSSNVRVVKGTAVYTTAFTPPTTPVTAITNTSLLLNMANAGIYDAAAQNNVTTVGEVQTSITPTPKFGVTTSIKFDPATNLDYLNILPVPPSLALGTSNFTIEGWIYFNTVAGVQTFFDQRPASTNGAYPVLYMNGATMIWYVNSAAQITSGSLSTLTWYYFAITRSTSVTRMYIDGAQVGSNYSDTNNYLASKTLIGVTNDIASGLNGNLQEFRITRGVARTVTTVPTAPFPTR
jgi:hypothetical protein